ncbi:MAG: S9 family peptidase [Gemmatimonadetes bacterium]|nr:S9 family peptidase [Gemmatimonadota bacterium]
MLMQSLRRVAALALLASPLAAQSTRAITFEDFSAMRGVSDPQLSPDGKAVLYAVRTTDVAANKRTTRTFVMASSGGAPRAWPDDRTAAAEARWSPDGARVAFTSGGQLWIADASGANARALTTLSTGAGGPVWSPAGDRIAFVSSVYPSCADDACNAAKSKAASESKVKAHLADQLMYRHWNAWDDGTRSHLFVVRTDGGDLRDLVPGATYDVPPGPFGGSEGYAISPDGKEAAFTAKAQGRADAWTTDLNVYTVAIAGGVATPVTATNKGADQNPVYTPDGKYILYASQKRGGLESDKWRLMAYDRAARTSRDLLPTWDRWAESYLVSPDSRTIYVGSGDRGRDKFFRVSLDAAGKAGTPAVIMGEHNNTSPTLASDGRTIAWVRDATERPAEVWIGTLAATGAVEGARALTHENDALVAQLTLHGAEDFAYVGAAGDSVFGFIVKPPQWKAGQKYPLLLLIHGGPQGAWLDSWGSRWAPQLFAQGGYGLVIINPHGSTGYGQKFTDAVSKDWGGKTYDDLMKGVDAALAKYPWLDSTRMAAAGGSYGGYMVNWIGGHTNRFKALVSHAGVFNLEAMAGATEEQWFPDAEFGGPFWSGPQMASQYRKYSPHLFVQHFKTPTLIIGGELDYRIPYSEGVSLFTALQRQGVASRLLVFPDEGHWVLKPQNSQLWWHEVHRWLGAQLSPKPNM